MPAAVPTVMSAEAVLDREFLEIRAKILQIAASLDRMDRGDGEVDGDERFGQLRQGLDILRESESGRAERVQLLFSRRFDSQWRKTFSI